MKKILCIFLLILSVNGDNIDDEEITDDNYNKTWMYFANGEDLPEIAYLTEPPEQKAFNDYNIVFEFYNRDNRTIPVKIQFAARERRSSTAFDSSAISNFDSNLDTKLLVHGWKSSTISDTIQTIKDEYLEKNSYNIIAVNWAEIASNSYYLAPVKHTRRVGKAISKLINYLVEEKKADPKRIHLIGHSLGAHTVGYAGSYSKYRVARITGLDPAAPCFEYGCNAGAEGRLDPTDADFVDVIHSCAGVLGYSDPVGHVDFYPNRGLPPQPGCGTVTEIARACSHGRAHRYYAESINSKTGFYGYPCKSWDEFKSGKCSNRKSIKMGDEVPYGSRGIYFLQTRKDFPFALGEKGKKD